MILNFNFLKIIILKWLFKDLKINNISYHPTVSGINNISSNSNLRVPKNCFFSGEINFGKYNTIGENCFFRGNITIGNYCQFGSYVSLHSRNHPMNYLSTYQGKFLFSGELKNLRTEKPIILKNDVWIGHSAIILSGVTIGNGAVIGAGAIVTKDVPDFAIVVGSPAKIISYRFDQKNINKINRLLWWNESPNDLMKSKKLFFKKYK